MSTTILTSIKKQLGIDESNIDFDPQVIMGINMAISVLTQIGIGSPSGFALTDGKELWTAYIPDLETSARYVMVQSYIYCRTKLFFDPPASQVLTNILKSTADELEWRLKAESEKG